MQRKKMSKSRVKPVYVMRQEGVSDLENAAVKDGVEELLRLGGIEGLVRIRDLGVWRTREHANPDGSLKRYQSVDWYVQRAEARDEEHRGQLLEGIFFHEFDREPWKEPEDHYDVLISASDLNTTRLGRNKPAFIIGAGEPFKGAVISGYRFKHKGLSSKGLYGCLKTAAIHELGHAFGLPGDGLNVYLEDRGDLRFGHCMNKCVMRQGVSVPGDWVRMSRDRERYGTLCSDCYSLLRKNISA